MTMNNNSQEFTTPGEKLGLLSQYLPGPGTHPWHDHVVASVVGLQHVVPPPLHAPDQVRKNISISCYFKILLPPCDCSVLVCSSPSPPIRVNLLKSTPTLHQHNPNSPHPNCHVPTRVLSCGLRPQKPLRMRWPKTAIQLSSNTVLFTISCNITSFDQNVGYSLATSLGNIKFWY